MPTKIQKYLSWLETAPQGFGSDDVDQWIKTCNIPFELDIWASLFSQSYTDQLTLRALQVAFQRSVVNQEQTPTLSELFSGDIKTQKGSLQLAELPANLAKQLKRLHIEYAEQADAIHIENCEELQLLSTFHCPKVTSLTLDNLPALQYLGINGLNKLESLNLTSYQDQLRFLNISNCRNFSQYEQIGLCKNLVHLVIHNQKNISNTDFLLALPNLRHLHLSASKLDDKSYQQLESLQHLEVIVVAGVKQQKRLSEALPNCSVNFQEKLNNA